MSEPVSVTYTYGSTSSDTGPWPFSREAIDEAIVAVMSSPVVTVKALLDERNEGARRIRRLRGLAAMHGFVLQQEDVGDAYTLRKPLGPWDDLCFMHRVDAEAIHAAHDVECLVGEALTAYAKVAPQTVKAPLPRIRQPESWWRRG